MDALPEYVSIIFVLVTAATYGFILFAGYFAFEGKRNPLSILASAMLIWLLATGYLAYSGFYLDYESVPPRLIIFVLPALLAIVILLARKKYRDALMKMPITALTFIHIVRIPVELCLWWLFGVGMVAEAMTFEGVNFDILAGISAPFAAVFLVGKRSKNKITAVIWNILCLGLVLNIVIRAISLTPYFYDGSGDQLQNLAVFHFPFIWLPTFVVPAVLFSHLVSLAQLLKKSDS